MYQFSQILLYFVVEKVSWKREMCSQFAPVFAFMYQLQKEYGIEEVWEETKNKTLI